MTMVRRPRRPSGGTYDPARAAEGFEASFLRFEGRFDEFAEGVFARFKRLEEDVRTGAISDARLQAEFQESRNDVGELRDGIAELRKEVEKVKSEQPAQGAVSAARETVGPTVAREVVKQFWANWVTRLGAAGVGFVAFVALIKEGPLIAVAIEGLWSWLKGLK